MRYRNLPTDKESEAETEKEKEGQKKRKDLLYFSALPGFDMIQFKDLDW